MFGFFKRCTTKISSFRIPFRKAYSLLETTNLLDEAKEIPVYTNGKSGASEKVGTLSDVVISFNAAYIQKQKDLNKIILQQQEATTKLERLQIDLEKNFTERSKIKSELKQVRKTIEDCKKLLHERYNHPDFIDYERYYVRELPDKLMTANQPLLTFDDKLDDGFSTLNFN